ncbi:MAG: TRAP transporter small permease subunit [Pseudomonadota bacterium]
MRQILALSDALNRLLAAIGQATSWLFVVAMVVICFDVVSRKLGFQIPGFGSTKLQELEWHTHTVLFATWLGYAYVRNAHVRIDVATGHLGARQQAWLELAGCLVFAIPYCLVVGYFGYDYALRSFLTNETSNAPTGLPYLWITKGVLFIGLMLLLAAVVSVLCRTSVHLFGPPELRARVAPAQSAH